MSQSYVEFFTFLHCQDRHSSAQWLKKKDTEIKSIRGGTAKELDSMWSAIFKKEWLKNPMKHKAYQVDIENSF